VPPLANGSAQPSVFNVVQNLRALGYQPTVNEKVLAPVEAHFHRCAKEAGLPIGAPREYDQGWYRHQVPGGMISNLRHQLKMLGKEDKMTDVLEEIVQVRAELGYPIMVTPFAQFVGSQAAINIMTGERYKEVTDQVIQFALGLWGKEGAEYMDKEVKAKILNRKRAREMESFEVPNTPLEEVRKQYGGTKISDEELIMRYYAGPEFVDALKDAPMRKEYLDVRKPLVKLVEEIVKKSGPASVYIRRNDFSLTAARRT
jgi:oxaloacetate decarboxylase alpha subunit